MPRSVSLLTLTSIFLVVIILVLGYAIASFIALLILLYTSIIVSKLYKGRLVSVLTTSLNLLSVPTFVALLPSWEGAFTYFKPLSYSILLGVLAYSVFLILNSVSENYREIIYPVSRSILLALVGLILWYLSNQIISSKTGIQEGIGYVILFSFLGTAILSLFDAIRELPGRTISLVATYLSRNLWRRSIFLLLTSAYLFVGRGIIINKYPDAQTYLIIAEWITLSALVLRSYWQFKGFIENEYVKPDQIENWSRHIQSIEWATDERMKGVADSIQDFLDRGVKDSLVVCLVGLMRDAGELEDSITSSLSPLIEYEDLHPGVVFQSLQEEYIKEKNRKRRMSIFSGTLSQLSKIGLKVQLPEGTLSTANEGDLKRT
jgi:hypothetical protein